MNQLKKSKSLFLAITLCCFSILSSSSLQATIVQFETNMGNFEVNLYDETTPETVANFLQYLNNSDYANAVFHRAETDFVLQGGGFSYNTNWPLDEVFTNDPVINEPVYSNVAGTIAMAKLSNNANSATNQWFFNLGNNSSNLDRQNSGFTVFGEVIGDGMAVINEIVAIQKYNLGGPFTSIPLNSYDVANDPNETNLVIISDIIITDATVGSATDLSPALNIGPAIIVAPPMESGSGGGSLGILMLGLLLLMTLTTKTNALENKNSL
ncbi:MAG: peptidyl-prolyl cis-trans isomerase A (cyclophilin A) [Enterobacterales bacterium]|jgi:peptidyl-prolyl cis-trans isomerase A (cyclophilin A)